jgi:hypothetical protein
MTYDLRRLRAHGLIDRIPVQPPLPGHRHRPAPRDVAHPRPHPLLQPGLAQLTDPDPPAAHPLRTAARAYQDALDPRQPACSVYRPKVQELGCANGQVESGSGADVPAAGIREGGSTHPIKPRSNVMRTPQSHTARVNRATNLVVASLYIPVSMFNAVGESWDLGLVLLLRPLHRTRGAAPGLHPALRLDLATPHRITGDPGSQPRQRATPHAAAGVTARPAPDHPSLAPPAGTVTCLSVRC